MAQLGTFLGTGVGGVAAVALGGLGAVGLAGSVAVTDIRSEAVAQLGTFLGTGVGGVAAVALGSLGAVSHTGGVAVADIDGVAVAQGFGNSVFGSDLLNALCIGEELTALGAGPVGDVAFGLTGGSLGLGLHQDVGVVQNRNAFALSDDVLTAQAVGIAGVTFLLLSGRDSAADFGTAHVLGQIHIAMLEGFGTLLAAVSAGVVVGSLVAAVGCGGQIFGGLCGVLVAQLGAGFGTGVGGVTTVALGSLGAVGLTGGVAVADIRGEAVAQGCDHSLFNGDLLGALIVCIELAALGASPVGGVAFCLTGSGLGVGLLQIMGVAQDRDALALGDDGLTAQTVGVTGVALGLFGGGLCVADFGAANMVGQVDLTMLEGLGALFAAVDTGIVVSSLVAAICLGSLIIGSLCGVLVAQSRTGFGTGVGSVAAVALGGLGAVSLTGGVAVADIIGVAVAQGGTGVGHRFLLTTNRTHTRLSAVSSTSSITVRSVLCGKGMRRISLAADIGTGVGGVAAVAGCGLGAIGLAGGVVVADILSEAVAQSGAFSSTGIGGIAAVALGSLGTVGLAGGVVVADILSEAVAQSGTHICHGLLIAAGLALTGLGAVSGTGGVAVGDILRKIMLGAEHLDGTGHQIEADPMEGDVVCLKLVSHDGNIILAGLGISLDGYFDVADDAVIGVIVKAGLPVHGHGIGAVLLGTHKGEATQRTFRIVAGVHHINSLVVKLDTGVEDGDSGIIGDRHRDLQGIPGFAFQTADRNGGLCFMGVDMRMGLRQHDPGQQHGGHKHEGNQSGNLHCCIPLFLVILMGAAYQSAGTHTPSLYTNHYIAPAPESQGKKRMKR